MNKNLQGLLQILGGQEANDSELSQEVLEALKGVKGDMEVKERFGVTFDDAREDGIEEGKTKMIEELILGQEKFGFTKGQIINFMMQSLNYSEAEAQELYDELAKEGDSK